MHCKIGVYIGSSFSFLLHFPELKSILQATHSFSLLSKLSLVTAFRK